MESPEASDLRGEQAGAGAEGFECGGEAGIAFGYRGVETIVSGRFSSGLPHAFRRIELGRVGRQTVKLDAVAVGREPSSPGLVEPVARAVVDHEEDLSSSIAPDQKFQKLVERVAIEHDRKLVGKPRIVQRDGAENVGCFPRAIGIYPRLDSDGAPRLVERSVKPEAGFVLEENGAPTCGGFFLIAGNVVLNHSACRARSARASRLRGLCTEKPS